MAREIKEMLYRVKGYSGIPHYVECSSEDDLFVYLVKEWLMKGYPIGSVNLIATDGTTPRVSVMSSKRFHKIKKEYMKEKKDD